MSLAHLGPCQPVRVDVADGSRRLPRRGLLNMAEPSCGVTWSQGQGQPAPKQAFLGEQAIGPNGRRLQKANAVLLYAHGDPAYTVFDSLVPCNLGTRLASEAKASRARGAVWPNLRAAFGLQPVSDRPRVNVHRRAANALFILWGHFVVNISYQANAHFRRVVAVQLVADEMRLHLHLYHLESAAQHP